MKALSFVVEELSGEQLGKTPPKDTFPKIVLLEFSKNTPESVSKKAVTSPFISLAQLEEVYSDDELRVGNVEISMLLPEL